MPEVDVEFLECRGCGKRGRIGLRLRGDSYDVGHHFGVPRSRGHIFEELSNLLQKVNDAPATELEIRASCGCDAKGYPSIERRDVFSSPAGRPEVFRSLRFLVSRVEHEIRGRR